MDYGDKNKEYFYKYAPKDFIDKLTKSADKKLAKDVVGEYWQKTLPKSFNKDNQFLIKWIEKLLNEEKDLVIKRVEKIYEKPFPFEEIRVYLTTCFFCPYNYKKLYFMINRNSNFFGILNTARHELNHFMFYYYFGKSLKKKGISLENIEFIKEALAILTSNGQTENEGRSPLLLKIEDFVKQNRNLSVEEIIDKVLDYKFFI